MVTSEELNQIYSEAECLHGPEAVEQALDMMAADITAKLGDTQPLVLCVMIGGIVPTGRLLPRLNFPLDLDYIHATRYGHSTQGGKLEWIVRPKSSLQGRVILLVDDIHDEGHTLAAVKTECRSKGATAVYSAVLVNKNHDRKNNMSADFVGLTVEDRYVFGCGMDYQGYWRNAPGIYALKDDSKD